MSSFEILALFPVPVLDSNKKYHHVTLPIGHYKLMRIDNPFPEDSKDPNRAPDWWIDENTGYGMTLEAWLSANRNQYPLIQITGVVDYASGAHLAEVSF